MSIPSTFGFQLTTVNDNVGNNMYVTGISSCFGTNMNNWFEAITVLALQLLSKHLPNIIVQPCGVRVSENSASQTSFWLAKYVSLNCFVILDRKQIMLLCRHKLPLIVL